MGNKNSAWLNIYSILIISGLLFTILSGFSSAQKILSIEFRERRNNLIKLLDDSSAVILKAADTKKRNGDVEYLFRQESNFLYLSGVDEPNCYLIILPEGIKIRNSKVHYIFFDPDDNGDTVINDHEAVLNSLEFNKIFNSILKNLNKIYTSSSDNPFYFDWLNNKMIFAEKGNKDKFELKHPGIKIKNLDLIISKLREIKSETEVSLIKKAIKITGDGFKEAVKLCRPGAWEYQLRGAIEGEMLKQGCDYTSFPSIIGSGKNSLVLHYNKDNMQMKDGEIVVMDIGGEYKGYAADITRTLPVSGKFNDAQKEIYNMVLEAQKQVIDIIKPGVTFYDLNKKTLEIFAQKGMENYMPHGVSHSVGLDVHDLTSSDTLRAGMIITVEPGLYFPEEDTTIAEKYRGFGIRIEDDVLVTTGGSKVLSVSIPKEIPEIETLFSEIKKR